MATKKNDDGWVSVTQAGILLEIRYLKARDLMTQGLLGDVKQTDSNRYFVRRDAVLDYKREREKAKGNTS